MGCFVMSGQVEHILLYKGATLMALHPFSVLAHPYCHGDCDDSRAAEVEYDPLMDSCVARCSGNTAK